MRTNLVKASVILLFGMALGPLAKADPSALPFFSVVAGKNFNNSNGLTGVDSAGAERVNVTKQGMAQIFIGSCNGSPIQLISGMPATYSLMQKLAQASSQCPLNIYYNPVSCTIQATQSPCASQL
jgi:hypothetical protein